MSKLGVLTQRPVPILTFHNISVPQSSIEEQFWVSPRRLERFIGWLRLARRRSTTLLEWTYGKAPNRSVCVTFDDGYADFYDEVFPNIERWQLKATIFLVVGQIGKFNTWDEKTGLRSRRLLPKNKILEMHQHGVEFGSHSLTHAWLPHLSDSQLRQEVGDSKSRLEDLLGCEVSFFAYPSGGVDNRVRAAVCEAGYKVALTARPGLSHSQDLMAVNRIEISQRDTVPDFALKVETGRSLLRESREGLFRYASSGLNCLPRPAAEKIRQVAARKLGIIRSRSR